MTAAGADERSVWAGTLGHLQVLTQYLYRGNVGGFGSMCKICTYCRRRKNLLGKALQSGYGHLGINDIGLAVLTLLVSDSDPKQKETLIRLIMNMLSTPGTVS